MSTEESEIAAKEARAEESALAVVINFVRDCSAKLYAPPIYHTQELIAAWKPEGVQIMHGTKTGLRGRIFEPHFAGR